uniref:Uncharacterized protein n=1 Tax=Arundo donax TaxID=35708 RepID=A0A0A9QKD4_ARUDO
MASSLGSSLPRGGPRPSGTTSDAISYAAKG